MPKRIEKDLEELSVKMFVNEYGSLRDVYNRLYVMIHIYYSGRRELVASEDTIPVEKLLQMHKDIATRLERVNTWSKDQQFPQVRFEDFAKEKLNKMYLAIGLIETASLIGELSTYSTTILDYMKSCCSFAAKFVIVLSDPNNQNLKALQNNLTTSLEQIDELIKQRKSGSASPAILHKEDLSVSEAKEKGKPTPRLSGSSSTSPRDVVTGAPAEAHSGRDTTHGYAHKKDQSASEDHGPSDVGPSRQQRIPFVTSEELQDSTKEYTLVGEKLSSASLSYPDDVSPEPTGHRDEGERSEDTNFAISEADTPPSLVSSLDEALNILGKIDVYRSKSRALEADTSLFTMSDTGVDRTKFDEGAQAYSADLSSSHKFQELLNEKYGFHPRSYL